MKKTFLTLALALSALSQTDAKIWRVNNSSTAGADFTSLQTAHNTAAAGDTLYVEYGSGSGYEISLTKKLVIIGPGYFLNENAQTQIVTSSPSIYQLSFRPGSAGSVVQGLTLTYVTVNESNVTIQRNRLVGTLEFATTHSVSGDTIRQNYVNVSIAGGTATNTCTGLLVYNNIYTASPFNVSTSWINNFSGYFINNSFLGSYNFAFQCVNFIIQNNILYGVYANSYISSNSWFNNIIGNTSLPAGNGNTPGTSLNDVYVGWSASSNLSSDGRCVLKAQSPARNAGVINGQTVDCGAFGGPAPYVLSGMPPIPSVYQLSVPNQIPTGTATMNVTISAAAH